MKKFLLTYNDLHLMLYICPKNAVKPIQIMHKKWIKNFKESGDAPSYIFLQNEIPVGR